MTHAAKTVAALFVLACSSASSLAAPSSAVTPHMPARKAFVVQPAERSQGCLGGAGLSHAAYVRAADGNLAGCSHFLSTDTLMTVHHWDRT